MVTLLIIRKGYRNNDVKDALKQYGAVAYHNHKYYFGLSVNQIIKVNDSFNRQFQSKNDYYFMGSYKFDNKGRFDFEPSLVVKLEDYETWHFDLHNRLYIFDYYWVSISCKSYYSQALDVFSGSLAFGLGLKVIRNIYVSYGFESNIGEVVQYYQGTHNFCIGTNIGLRAVQGVRKFVKD